MNKYFISFEGYFSRQGGGAIVNIQAEVILSLDNTHLDMESIKNTLKHRYHTIHPKAKDVVINLITTISRL